MAGYATKVLYTAVGSADRFVSDYESSPFDRRGPATNSTTRTEDFEKAATGARGGCDYSFCSRTGLRLRDVVRHFNAFRAAPDLSLLRYAKACASVERARATRRQSQQIRRLKSEG
jgi:hypothetical protein